MTAARRILPLDHARETLDMLREYGIDLAVCEIDIGPDRVKVRPPANHNGGELAKYIDRPSRNPKTAEKR